jgi:hypothetical protein
MRQLVRKTRFTPAQNLRHVSVSSQRSGVTGIEQEGRPASPIVRKVLRGPDRSPGHITLAPDGQRDTSSSGAPSSLPVGQKPSRGGFDHAGDELPLPIREPLERSWGFDFSRIRIHAGGEGGDVAASVGANAVTVGRHIAFAPGRFAPETSAGRRLIMHEVVHAVQQGFGDIPTAQPLRISSPGDRHEREARAISNAATPSSTAPPAARTPVHMACDLPLAAAAANNVEYIEISMSSNVIVFHSASGTHQYTLRHAGLTTGTYRMSVTVDGNRVHLTPGTGSAGMTGRWSWRLQPNQPNPATLLRGQAAVEVRITERPLAAPGGASPAPEAQPHPSDDPNAAYLTPEEAQRRCNANTLQVMTFPLRFTRFNDAYVIATREAGGIRVRMPVHVLGNNYFRRETRTLPRDVFTGGVLLQRNQIVRVRFHQPRINPFADDEIREQCFTGEDMLDLSDAGDRAIGMNMALTAVDALMFAPVGAVTGRAVSQAATRVGQRVVAPVLAAGMIATARAAPAATGAASRAAITAVEAGAAAEVSQLGGSQLIRQTVAQTMAAQVAAPTAGAGARAGMQAMMGGAGLRVVTQVAGAAALDTAGGALRDAATEHALSQEGPGAGRTLRIEPNDAETVHPNAPVGTLPTRRMVVQIEDVSCGPACAEMAAEHYGVRTTQQTIMQEPGYVRPRVPGTFDPAAGMEDSALSTALNNRAQVPGRSWVVRRYSPTSAQMRGRGEITAQLRRALRDGDGVAILAVRNPFEPGMADPTFHYVVVDAIEGGAVVVRDPARGRVILEITETGFGDFPWAGRAIVARRLP